MKDITNSPGDFAVKQPFFLAEIFVSVLKLSNDLTPIVRARASQTLIISEPDQLPSGG